MHLEQMFILTANLRISFTAPGILRRLQEEPRTSVFSKEGYLWGMVVGGSNPKLGQGLGKVHGIVVPIDRIFADIELITGSKASLPP